MVNLGESSFRMHSRKIVKEYYVESQPSAPELVTAVSL
jgi:hypothetical protein